MNEQKTKKKIAYPKKFKYSYSFGELGKDPIDQKGGSQSHYGASMNKPILAFVNLVLAKEGAKNTKSGNAIRKLNDDELDKMIAYRGEKVKGKWRQKSDWSNRVNRAVSNMSRVSGKDKWGNESGYYKKTSGEVGVSKEQAQKVLEKLGLSDSISGVHWGGASNKQSTDGYHKFMSMMHKFKSDPKSDYHDEATNILYYVNKRQGGQGAQGLKKRLNKRLEKAGYGKDAVQSITGKGGYVEGTLNYSVVINGKYSLSLYSSNSTILKTTKEWDEKKNKYITKHHREKVGAMRPRLNDIAFDAITKNLKPDQLGVGSLERQKQDLEIKNWNDQELEQNMTKFEPPQDISVKPNDNIDLTPPTPPYKETDVSAGTKIDKDFGIPDVASQAIQDTSSSSPEPIPKKSDFEKDYESTIDKGKTTINESLKKRIKKLVVETLKKKSLINEIINVDGKFYNEAGFGSNVHGTYDTELTDEDVKKSLLDAFEDQLYDTENGLGIASDDERRHFLNILLELYREGRIPPEPNVLSHDAKTRLIQQIIQSAPDS